MSEINVATTFATGTTIHMDAVETLNFIELTAMTVIRMSDEIENNYNFDTHIFKSKYRDDIIDSLINTYTDGVHGAVLMNMYCNYISILYQFVQDIVLNESVRGLFLFNRINRFNHSAYELICLALEKGQKLYEKRSEIGGYECKTRYTEYNDEFIKMMKGEEE